MDDMSRESAARWSRGMLTWATQFDDLRIGIDGVRETTLKRELKTLALFKPSCVIRDAAVINSLELQAWLIDDVESISAALRCGAIALGLRKDAECFEALHSRTGPHRAFPERADACTYGVKMVDHVVRSLSLIGETVRVDGMPSRPSLVDLPTANPDDFEEGVRRIVNDVADDERRAILERALEVAIARAGRPLRFGHMHDYLTLEAGLARSSEIVQLCRVAHTIALPSSLGLPFSTAASDIRAEQTLAVLGAQALPCLDPELLQQMWPKKYLTDRALDSLSFNDIAGLRRLGTELGYFRAVADLHCASRDGFERTYFVFMTRLGEYLEAMAVEAKVELPERAGALVQERLEAADEFYDVGTWAVPVVINSALAVLVSISVLPLEIMAAGAALQAGSEGIRQLGMHRRKTRPDPIRRIAKQLAFTPQPKQPKP